VLPGRPCQSGKPRRDQQPVGRHGTADEAPPRPIPCRGSQGSNGSVPINRLDGLAMTDQLIQPGLPRSILRSGRGGRWQRQVLPRGNAVVVNAANG